MKFWYLQISQNLVGFLGDLKTAKFHSEINWPLIIQFYNWKIIWISFFNPLYSLVFCEANQSFIGQGVIFYFFVKLSVSNVFPENWFVFMLGSVFFCSGSWFIGGSRCIDRCGFIDGCGFVGGGRLISGCRLVGICGLITRCGFGLVKGLVY